VGFNFKIDARRASRRKQTQFKRAVLGFSLRKLDFPSKICLLWAFDEELLTFGEAFSKSFSTGGRVGCF